MLLVELLYFLFIRCLASNVIIHWSLLSFYVVCKFKVNILKKTLFCIRKMSHALLVVVVVVIIIIALSVLFARPRTSCLDMYRAGARDATAVKNKLAVSTATSPTTLVALTNIYSSANLVVDYRFSNLGATVKSGAPLTILPAATVLKTVTCPAETVIILQMYIFDGSIIVESPGPSVSPNYPDFHLQVNFSNLQTSYATASFVFWGADRTKRTVNFSTATLGAFPYTVSLVFIINKTITVAFGQQSLDPVATPLLTFTGQTIINNRSITSLTTSMRVNSGVAPDDVFLSVVSQ
jgi:hypothetical protein